MCCVTKGVSKVALEKSLVQYSLSITPRSPRGFFHLGLLLGNTTENTKVSKPSSRRKEVLEEIVLGKPQ